MTGGPGLRWRHDNVVAFHPQYFDQGIANGSDRYNYYGWHR